MTSKTTTKSKVTAKNKYNLDEVRYEPLDGYNACNEEYVGCCGAGITYDFPSDPEPVVFKHYLERRLGVKYAEYLDEVELRNYYLGFLEETVESPQDAINEFLEEIDQNAYGLQTAILIKKYKNIKKGQCDQILAEMLKNGWEELKLFKGNSGNTLVLLGKVRPEHKVRTRK